MKVKPQQKASLKFIAKLVGCSTTTVSNVINQKGMFGDEIREKILKAVKKYNYTINPSARNLRMGRSETVAVVFYRPNVEVFKSEFYITMMYGLQKRLAELGFEILLSEITKTEAENNERPRFVSRGKADAIVVLGRAPQNIVESLAECGLPMLILDSYSKNIDSIYTDGEKATATLTEHLLEKGHKKIAYFACDNLDFNTDMRIKGFLNTMKNAKLEKNAILVRNFETIEESNVHFDKLMASKNRPTAILAANDDLATNLMFHAQAKGMRVPQDIAFAGFDDINLAVRCMPQLTTVHVDCAKIGEIGADTIVERIKNPNLHTRTQIFNVDMVARSSTK